MTRFEYLTPASPAGVLKLADVKRVTDSLREGGLAVLPTETGYMIAALATSPDAIVKAFAVKGRDLANTMHVACSSLDMAARYGTLTPRATRLLGQLTPGPVTVVVRQTDKLPDHLVTRDGTVGIRVPDQAATLQVIAALGAPLTATSLNKAGDEGGPLRPDELESLAWPDDELVHVVMVADAVRYVQPSTLVRVTGEAFEILRTGPVDEATIIRAGEARRYG